MTRTPAEATLIPQLYSPMERAVLARYLSVADTRPGDLRGLDPVSPVPRQWNERKSGIGPQASEICDDLIVENAVARICLESIAATLPQWAVVGEGVIERSRKPRRTIPRARALKPLHLLTINWGDSGPGFSWPEAYHVTWLPGYEISVVTASADSPDTHGYCDRAVGWFAGPVSDLEQAARCVRSYWDSQKECCQERWAYLFDEGAFDEATANGIADAVWPNGQESE